MIKAVIVLGNGHDVVLENVTSVFHYKNDIKNLKSFQLDNMHPLTISSDSEHFCFRPGMVDTIRFVETAE